MFWMILLGWLACAQAAVTNSISWDRHQQTLTAELHSVPLTVFLEKLARVTGWQVFVEPGTAANVAGKVRQQPIGEAMRSLLGKLSYALVPQTDAAPKFFVFRTTVKQATLRVKPEEEKITGPIPDELIVTLKAGTDADALAKALGAKIIGRVDGLNTYRLKFDSEVAASAARNALKSNSAVGSVDSNYYMDRPRGADALQAQMASDLRINARAVGNGNEVIVGLVDTYVQDTGTAWDKFLRGRASVAGEANLKTAEPTHGTGMYNSLIRGMEAALREGSTGIGVYSVDVYGANANTTTFDVASGIHKAIKEGGANIINLSLAGAGDSSFLHEIIKTSSEKGVLIFAATGNEGSAAPSYPAAYPEVIAVAAGDKEGNLASYANRSDKAVVAPGTAIVTYDGRSYVITGTSTSSAFTAGLAAGLSERYKKDAKGTSAMIYSILPSPKKTQ